VSFEVWIRTFQDRLYLAEQLKQVSRIYLSENTYVLDTKQRSAYFSEKFVLCMYSQLQMNITSEYILILEDDIAFTESAKASVLEKIDMGYPCLWFSVPEQRCLDMATPQKDGVFKLLNPKVYYYSGAVLIKKQLLKEFVTEFLFSQSELEYKNFDTTLSRFLIRRYGFIDILPSYFGTRPHTESSINFENRDASRLEVNISELDPKFNPKEIVPELKEYIKEHK
jgi:hypothetical protein